MINFLIFDESIFQLRCFFVEARRRVIHVFEQTSFSADIHEEYRNDFNVLFEVKVITQLFKDEDYSTLSNEYNDHELTERDLVN